MSDLQSFPNATPVQLAQYQHLTLWVIGCGGTGSFLVQILFRLANAIARSGKQVSIKLVDPDHVEPINTLRQCFCDREAQARSNKAQSLAFRYSLAWNSSVEVSAIAQPFNPGWVDPRYNELHILLGCVDNAEARRSIDLALEPNASLPPFEKTPRVWYLDAGNDTTWGQILIGSDRSRNPELYKFHQVGCLRLPSPSLQAPELFQEEPNQTKPEVSCEDLLLVNQQSLTINCLAATLMAQLLGDLLTGRLKRYAVYFDQTSGTVKSKYINQESVLALL